MTLCPDFRFRRRAGLGTEPARHPDPGAAMHGRAWPTDKIRPGESVPDYCRRLDVMENLRHGSAAR